MEPEVLITLLPIRSSSAPCNQDQDDSQENHHQNPQRTILRVYFQVIALIYLSLLN